jgi:hypothetical protein
MADPTKRPRIVVLATAVVLLSCGRQSSTPGEAPAPTPAPASAELRWPPLPTEGFVAGRAATPEDVHAGRAAFSMQDDGQPIGEPLPVPVPQYAFHVAQSGERTPGIIIQAEVGKGIAVYGMRTIPDGALVSGLEAEFALLGTSVPSEPPRPSQKRAP